MAFYILEQVKHDIKGFAIILLSLFTLLLFNFILTFVVTLCLCSFFSTLK